VRDIKVTRRNRDLVRLASKRRRIVQKCQRLIRLRPFPPLCRAPESLFACPRLALSYSGEGGALTTDGKRIVMSDGTAELRFWDPETLKELGASASQTKAGP
jgi:hypothetical protein